MDSLEKSGAPQVLSFLISPHLITTDVLTLPVGQNTSVFSQTTSCAQSRCSPRWGGLGENLPAALVGGVQLSFPTLLELIAWIHQKWSGFTNTFLSVSLIFFLKIPLAFHPFLGSSITHILHSSLETRPFRYVGAGRWGCWLMGKCVRVSLRK